MIDYSNYVIAAYVVAITSLSLLALIVMLKYGVAKSQNSSAKNEK